MFEQIRLQSPDIQFCLKYNRELNRIIKSQEISYNCQSGPRDVGYRIIGIILNVNSNVHIVTIAT